MCGIGGWFGAPLDGLDHARQMVGALRHRGPDACGIKAWPDTVLVATPRLSIIDLSPRGRQPMSNEDGTIWVVFNGEIYNHRELRDDMLRRGHRMSGRSDTAVLPHLYEEYGAGFLSRLRGMFAIAVYDRRRRKCLLAGIGSGSSRCFSHPAGDVSPSRVKSAPCCSFRA